MPKVTIYELDELDLSKLLFVVIASRIGDKWIYCKHKERDTWEMPGGHIEPNEEPLESAKRELMEETGATKFKIEPVCLYSVSGVTETYGLLCYAEVYELGSLLESEIGEIALFETEPENLTYPEILPTLFAEIERRINTI